MSKLNDEVAGKRFNSSKEALSYGQGTVGQMGVEGLCQTDELVS